MKLIRQWAGMQITLLLLATVQWTASSNAAPLYSVTNLGNLNPSSINASGQVAGSALTINGYVAVRWSNGVLQSLGDLPGGGNLSLATAINQSGQVAGYSEATAGYRGFRWTNSEGLLDLGALPGDDLSFSTGINAAGSVVGYSYSLVIENHTFLWTSENGMQDLGHLGAFDSRAFAINDAGQAVGWSSSESGVRAFRWTNGFGMQSLGKLPGGDNYSAATAINNLGQVVGHSGIATGVGAFLWTGGGGMQYLGELPGGTAYSVANGINNSGQIVGNSDTGIDMHAFLWTSAGGIQDLNGLLDSTGAGWLVYDAVAVNDAGQILARGYNSQGLGIHGAILLTPVPEPSSLMLAACAGVGLVGFALRRSRLERR